MRRKWTYRMRIWLLLLLLVVLAGGTVACVGEDFDMCKERVNLRFQYNYNMQQTDGLEREASCLSVWIFDAQELLVEEKRERVVDFTDDFSLSLLDLKPGEYTIVAVAEGEKQTGVTSGFDIPSLIKGNPLSELHFRLQRNRMGENDCALNTLLCGVLRVHITGQEQSLTMEMMKLTNTVRILLIPANGEQQLKEEEVDILITDRNGWLAYDASVYREDMVTYRPYYQKAKCEVSDGYGENYLIVAELSTSRLIYDLHPRLLIRNRKNQQEILNIDLTWLLSQQAIAEHQQDWSVQEYLDRQDEYVITFVTCGPNGGQTKIVVNGWVLSMSDIGLQI